MDRLYDNAGMPREKWKHRHHAPNRGERPIFTDRIEEAQRLHCAENISAAGTGNEIELFEIADAQFRHS